MKKGIIFFVSLFCFFITGCTIDYTSYYEKYGDISNKDYDLTSIKIKDNVISYPDDNGVYISKYGDVYSGVSSEYKIYASYYSSEYDTLFISYDNIEFPIQNIDSRDLALIEEHMLNYFVSDSAKTDYKEYLKVIRIYPDYHSSVCRLEAYSLEYYSRIEGCAQYNGLEANININNLTNIERFFKPNGKYEPKRDTLAHEFGHVSTYYNMILKSDDTYEDYLKLRLGEMYDEVYRDGFPSEYEGNEDEYSIQPEEILADDYVELYYDTSKKVDKDYYDYTLEYVDDRRSLEYIDGVNRFLKDDIELFNKIKEYYDLFINKNYIEYEEPIVINTSSVGYNTLHDILNDKIYLHLNNAGLIALGEVEINNNTYYRVILSNVITEQNIRGEFSSNIGYVLKEDNMLVEAEVVLFAKFQGEDANPNSIYNVIGTSYHIAPYYDFSYYIIDNNKVKLYNYLDPDFQVIEFSLDTFN